jgi:hypothetical protein
MKLFIFLLMLLIVPAVGLHFIYRAYRIWLKSDYSSIKNSHGEVIDNPETYAPQVAKLHLVSGILVLASCALIYKYSFLTVIYAASAVVAIFRISIHRFLK